LSDFSAEWTFYHNTKLRSAYRERSLFVALFSELGEQRCPESTAGDYSTCGGRQRADRVLDRVVHRAEDEMRELSLSIELDARTLGRARDDRTGIAR